MIRPLTAALATLLLLAACDKPEPVTYTIPKEERNVAEAVQAPQPSAPAADGNKMQVLPGMQEAAQAAPELAYEVPEGWEEFPPQSVRKANFRVSDENGSAELAVTVFPGDVGGTLANINRWRGQIGLDPIDAEGMPPITRPFTISDHGGIIVDLQGPEQSILGGILSFHGSTWFFKMQGATGTIAGQAEAMEAFLSSVRIEDEHH
ncbi:MAG TPA: hypothetical protein VJ952_04935 [Opitutales bacterium]|nr:hypothetical protein [Opitutales bacterium]